MNVSPGYFSKEYFEGAVRSNYTNYNSLDNDGYWRSIIEIVEKYNISGRALDVGCAFGFLLKRLRPYFDEVYGLDVSSYALEQAKKSVPMAKLSRSDLNKGKLPYKSDFFDLITALDVLEHTDSLAKSISKLASKLRPGGYMIVSLPVRDTWARRMFAFMDKDKSHVGVPSLSELHYAIEQAGLLILSEKSFMPLTHFKIYGIPAGMELVCRKGVVKSRI